MPSNTSKSPATGADVSFTPVERPEPRSDRSPVEHDPAFHALIATAMNGGAVRLTGRSPIALRSRYSSTIHKRGFRIRSRVEGEDLIAWCEPAAPMPTQVVYSTRGKTPEHDLALCWKAAWDVALSDKMVRAIVRGMPKPLSSTLEWAEQELQALTARESHKSDDENEPREESQP